MKYHISREQNFFFEKNHYIEFDELLTQQEQTRLWAAVGQSCRYNLSHKLPEVKKIAQLPRLARLASELCGKREMRFAFDRLLEVPLEQGTLQEQSCISPLTCALLLSLDATNSHGLYLLPTVELSTLPQNGHALLIAWAEPRAQYLFEARDPFQHELKALGYVFGDRLKEKWHPVVVR